MEYSIITVWMRFYRAKICFLYELIFEIRLIKANYLGLKKNGAFGFGGRNGSSGTSFDSGSFTFSQIVSFNIHEKKKRTTQTRSHND